MKLYYFRGEQPNFGDDLNNWMWPKLLPNVWNGNEDTIFLGIGSIIYDFFPKDAKKIVFGAGYGGYTPLPLIDENWKFYFVRGKLTADKLNIDQNLAVGDAAILLRSCIEMRPPKRHRISFMPHCESALDGAWPNVCRLAGINYIDPAGTVDHIIDEILCSDLVVTEAMHGAIVADALRVPWIAIKPLQPRHHMKWQDWASALDLTFTAHSMGPSTPLEAAIQWAGSNISLVEKIRHRGKYFRGVFPSMFAERAAEQLLKISHESSSLSKDTSIESAHQMMLEKLDILLIDLNR